MSKHSTLVALAASLTLVSIAAYAAARSTKEGAFTEAQAARGQIVYERSCKNCHQAEFYQERLVRWKGKPVGELFQAVSTSMPADNVGSLLTSEYIDVLAYVFSITGSPVGKEELTEDTMDNVKIVLTE